MYEYKIVAAGLGSELIRAQEELDRLGSNGWRVITTASAGANFPITIWTLERVKRA